jgi:heme/copper-type cytochrome/quinol oxidase subunit 2
MLTKIIVTLAVIVGCLWFASSKRNHELQPVQRKPGKKEIERKLLLTRSAFAFMFLMVLAAGVIVFFELQNDYETVTVHVINSETNTRTSYEAQRQDVTEEGFTTLEGRKVFVADVERVEVESPK